VHASGLSASLPVHRPALGTVLDNDPSASNALAGFMVNANSLVIVTIMAVYTR